MDILLLVLCAIIGYLIGSVNSSVIVGRFFKTDIRKQGSGNAGLTNTLRVLGKKAAIFVLLGDILKGVIACLLGLLIVENGMPVAGTFAVVGHNWPVYFGFKGGKGVLTSATVVFMLDWRIGLVVLAIFIIIVSLTRFVSLGSILSAIAVPIGAVVADKGVLFIVCTLVLAAMILFRHRGNMVRLWQGREHKLTFRKD
ncbi:MAG: glycerol-3-phosphate 1-O-acyltransferase PlsY [Clostridia bacterium]